MAKTSERAGVVTNIHALRPSNSQAGETTTNDLTSVTVRDLIGLLASLEDSTRGWPGAAWTGRWTNADVDVEGIVSLQRQVIMELRRRRRQL